MTKPRNLTKITIALITIILVATVIGSLAMTVSAAAITGTTGDCTWTFDTAQAP